MDRLLFRLRYILLGKYGVVGEPFCGTGHYLHTSLPRAKHHGTLLCHQGDKNWSVRPDHLRAKINWGPRVSSAPLLTFIFLLHGFLKLRTYDPSPHVSHLNLFYSLAVFLTDQNTSTSVISAARMSAIQPSTVAPVTGAWMALIIIAVGWTIA